MSGRDDSGLLDDAPLGNRVVPPWQPFLPGCWAVDGFDCRKE